MKVELLYSNGCPHWTVAQERLAQALTTLGRDDITVELRPVETTARAEEFGFTGCPMIRLDAATSSRPMSSTLGWPAGPTRRRRV